jgi:hypothetical protein
VIIQIHAEVKFVQLYTCSVCGAKERGDTVRTTYDGVSTAGLKEFVDSQHPRSTNMPVSWSYNGAFKCAQHT